MEVSNVMICPSSHPLETLDIIRPLSIETSMVMTGDPCLKVTPRPRVIFNALLLNMAIEIVDLSI